MDEDLTARVRAVEFLMTRLVAHIALQRNDPKSAPAVIDAQLGSLLQSTELGARAKSALRDIFEDAKRLAEDAAKTER